MLDPRGTIGRREFWTGMAISLAVFVLLTSTATGMTSRQSSFGPIALIAVAFVISFWASFVSTTKRLADLGHSRWWIVLNLMPGIGQLMFLYLGFAKGKSERENETPRSSMWEPSYDWLAEQPAAERPSQRIEAPETRPASRRVEQIPASRPAYTAPPLQPDIDLAPPAPTRKKRVGTFGGPRAAGFGKRTSRSTRRSFDQV